MVFRETGEGEDQWAVSNQQSAVSNQQSADATRLRKWF